MAIEVAFSELVVQLRGLDEVLASVGMTTGEDRSKAEEPILVDNLNDTVVHFQGQLKKVSTEAAKAQRAVGPSVDLNRARRQLAAAQTLFHELHEAMAQDLFSYERLGELAELGRRSGPQWLKWTDTVREGLARLIPQLHTVLRSFFRCWQEIAERGSVNSVSVQATGQRIEVGPQALREIEAREIT